MELEKEAIDFVRGLNSAFEQQHYQSYFYLAEEEVMKDAWLLQIIKKLQEKEMTVMGMKQLKKQQL